MVTEQYKIQVKKMTKGEFEVLSDYIDEETPILYLHNKIPCMQKSWIKPKRFHKNKYKCPACRRKEIAKKNLKTNKEFLEEVKSNYGDEYEVLDEYKGNKQTIHIKHNSRICNYHIFKATPNNFLRGSLCPKCNSNASFPEQLILLTILDFYPKARKRRFCNRECDIFFTFDNINIGIQYDGFFFHKDVEKDNEFNKIFLQEKNYILFRIRESGCPSLKQLPNLEIIETSNKYTFENLSLLIKELFKKINKRLNRNDIPKITKQKFLNAHLYTRKTYHYKVLLEEYIEYLNKYKKRPSGKSHNDLQGRYTRAKLENKFEKEEIEKVENLLIKYKLLRKRLSKEECIDKLQLFFEKNHFLPRQASTNEEKHLYLDLKYYRNHNAFSNKQLDLYNHLAQLSKNNYITNESLFKKYLKFIHNKKRLPNFSSKEEKFLNSMINHRIYRKSFSKKQISAIEIIKKHYSKRYLKVNIVNKYIQFVTRFKKLPSTKGKKEEHLLEKNMLRFLNKNSLTEEQKRKIVEIRRPYLTIKRRLLEYNKFLNGGIEDFVKREYNEFCLKNERIPKKNYQNKEEYYLFQLVLKHLNIKKFPLCIKKKERKKINKKVSAADILFKETMNFLEKEGHFPLHIKKKNKDKKRSYEGRLAARITQCYRNNKFSKEQRELIDKYRIKNKDKPILILKKFLEYVALHDNKAPKHNDGVEEDRLLCSLKGHIKSNKYTKEQLKIISSYIKFQKK